MLTVFFDLPSKMMEDDSVQDIIFEFQRAGLRVVETYMTATYLVHFLGSPERMFPLERTIQARNFVCPKSVDGGLLFDIGTKCMLLSDEGGGPLRYTPLVAYFSEFVLQDPAEFR